MIRFFRKRDPETSSAAAVVSAAIPAHAVPLRDRITRLPQGAESALLNRLQALVADPLATDADWAILDRDITAAAAQAGDHTVRLAASLVELRSVLDDLRHRVAGLPDPDRARWRHWLALTAEAVDAARARADLADLTRLAVEAREHARSLAGTGPTVAALTTESEMAALRVSARRMLDDAESLVARLPHAEEERARQRLRRLQRLFQELMDLRDPQAARVLMLHLEEARDDLLRRAGTRAGDATLADQFPASLARPSANPEES